MSALPFQDRKEAGKALAGRLALLRKETEVVVLALPRGGVPVGAEIAHKLEIPLDILMVRKLGVPWQPELAFGAITSAVRVLDYQLIRDLRISDAQIDWIVTRETKELQRRERLYRGRLPALSLAERVVVLVDDGLATGSSMAVAAKHVRSQRAQALIIAAPVGSLEACERLRREADECLCLATPKPFYAVGEWYNDFRQVSDSEVRAILERHSASVELSKT